MEDVGTVTTMNTGVTLIAKWGKERITLEGLNSETTIRCVKDLLSERTGVLQKRQKLIGLSAKGGMKVDDDLILSDLKVKNGKSTDPSEGVVHQFIMMGTKEEQIFVDPAEKDDMPDVVDDFDLDFNAGSSEVRFLSQENFSYCRISQWIYWWLKWLQHVANGENLKKFTEHTAVHIMNEPRDGKPLLVLDLDHTLLDFSSRRLQQDSSTNLVGEGMAASMKR